MACKNKILSQISPPAQRSIGGHQLHIHMFHGPSQDGMRRNFPFLGHHHLSILSFSCLSLLVLCPGFLPESCHCSGNKVCPAASPAWASLTQPVPAVSTCRDKDGVSPTPLRDTRGSQLSLGRWKDPVINHLQCADPVSSEGQ